MTSNRSAAVLLVLAVGSIAATAAPIRAGLSGPPPSYVIPASDGKHLLVMLSPVLLAEDTGNDCVLPDGEKVKLRERFRSSGLYEIGSTTPVWAVDWYELEYGPVRISADGRYVVRVNHFGAGGWGEGVKLRWGIKFYDTGREIKSYDVAELVDYPSLMPLVTCDWHLLWIDEDAFPSEIRDGSFVLNTSTHDRYRFDVTTGEIVEEFRLWRTATRLGVAALIVLGASGGFLVWRRRKRRASSAAHPRPSPDTAGGPEERPQRWSFSIRSLLIAQAITAVLCVLACTVPHIAVLLLAMTPAMSFTRLLIRAHRAAPWTVLGASRRWGRAGLWWLAGTTWLVFYALSCAPVWGCTIRLDWPYDVRMVLVKVVYGPVYWLLEGTAVGHWHAVQLYFRAWGC